MARPRRTQMRLGLAQAAGGCRDQRSVAVETREEIEAEMRQLLVGEGDGRSEQRRWWRRRRRTEEDESDERDEGLGKEIRDRGSRLSSLCERWRTILRKLNDVRGFMNIMQLLSYFSRKYLAPVLYETPSIVLFCGNSTSAIKSFAAISLKCW
jgi:hypothetical protein